MEFRLLGPLEVVDDGGAALPLGGPRPRALLALLLLDANQVVSTDRLIDGVWGEAPPASAQSALQVHVHALRKVLGADRILTRSPGYSIRVEESEVDLHRFENLVAAGRLSEALGLWRGRVLEDVAYEPFVQSEASRLEEARLSAVEARIATDLDAGRHAALDPGARGARRGASPPRAVPCAADARSLSLGTTGGRASLIPGGTPGARRRARDRPLARVAGAGAGDPPSGPGPRRRLTRCDGRACAEIADTVDSSDRTGAGARSRKGAAQPPRGSPRHPDGHGRHRQDAAGARRCARTSEAQCSSTSPPSPTPSSCSRPWRAPSRSRRTRAGLSSRSSAKRSRDDRS